MIKITNFTKRFDETLAVDKLNLEIKDGEILGFLGPNGAGKTTTLRAITGYLQPTDGSIEVDGVDVETNPISVKSSIGYMPEQNPLYEEMLVRDFLKFSAEIRGIKGKSFEKAFDFVVEECGIKKAVARPIHQLSKGFKQRVGLSCAILHDPKILILDEPTSGLDPNQIIEIRRLIKELGRRKTLILSSHILGEVQAVCDRIVIINDGLVVADGTSESLKSSFQGKAELQIVFKDPKNQMGKLKFSRTEILKSKTLDKGEKMITLTFSAKEDIRSKVYKKIKSTDIVLLEMRKKQVNLEDVFTSLTKEVKQ